VIWDAIISSAPRYWLFNRLADQAQKEVEQEEAARLEAIRVRTLAVAHERATLMEEWARWEESEPDRLAAAQQKAAVHLLETCARVEKTKALLLTAARDVLGDEEGASWVEKQIQRLHRSSILASEEPDLAGFMGDCGTRLREAERHKFAIDTERNRAREALLRVAMTKFGATDLADLWMRTTNPKIGRRRPIDVCLEHNGIELCKAALA